MAGTTSKTESFVEQGFSQSVRTKKIVVSFTADSADGSVPDTTVALDGYLVKIVTNPGATAPTDNWDFVINDAGGVDVLGGAGANRDTTNTEQIYPTISGATVPVWCEGSHTLAISGNSVNSAVGTITIYVKDRL